MKQWQRELLRAIPPVGEILASPTAAELMQTYARPRLVAAIAESLELLRQRIKAAATASDVDDIDLRPSSLALLAAAHLARVGQPHLCRVINATGVILHTNLGRAPLPQAAIERLSEAAAHYTNLELDLETGERGSRYSHIEALLCRLTGAEAAMAVNNNAAAVLLSLSALAAGLEVIVSRGELVEIGGSFRIPEVMAQGGARLVEVGTTNKTRLTDYERAMTDQTAALLKVHTSNYRIIGFTAEVAVADLARLGRARGVPVVADLGSGALLPAAGTAEPTVQEWLEQGADLVTFSGDKLLGGPQAGLVVGRRDLIQRLRRHPLTRALRIDKLAVAALEGTLRLYLDPAAARQQVPILQMLAADPAELQPRAQELAALIVEAAPDRVTVGVSDGFSQAGGGALPARDLPTRLVTVTAKDMPAARLEQRLRRRRPPVLARIHKEQLLFDVRTLRPDEPAMVARAVAAALADAQEEV